MMVANFKGHGMSWHEIISYVHHVTHFGLSKKLVVDGKMVGFYLLTDDMPIQDRVEGCKLYADLDQFEGKRGIEGIALVIHPTYRGTGLGNQLKNLPQTMGYDYIYGQQLKTLKNLDDWLKRRMLVADCGDVWITAEMFKPQ